MRTPWKRAALGLMIAGAVGTAALALAQQTEPPPVIPHADDPTRVPELLRVPPPPEPAPVVVQAKALEPVQTNDPAVALEWSGPAVTKVNTPTEYTLTVRNTCGQNLQKVTVQVRPPKGVTVAGTKPAVKPTDGVYLWEIGNLDAKTSKAVAVTLSQPTRGDLACQAWVTFTGSTAMKAVVKEPKLAVTIKAPETVVLGDTIPVEYAVSNPGDLSATCVQVSLTGVKDHLPCPELKPGATQKWAESVKATAGGTFTYEAAATGDDGLRASVKATVQVLVPKLAVSVQGPAEGLIGTKGKYTVTVTNSGEVPVSGVTVSEVLPAGFKVSSAGDGKQTADKLTWAAGDLAVGASKAFEFEGCTSQPGSLTHKVEAAGDRNTKAACECVTKVEGIPGLRMELVDSVDPVEKNGEVTYEIKVTNTGTKADSDVVIVCELPKELEYISCSGPTANVALGYNSPLEGAKPNSVTFDPITDLAPKTEAVFKVKVKGTATGDVRFKATMTSKHLTAPVTKEESTRVYGE